MNPHSVNSPTTCIQADSLDVLYTNADFSIASFIWNGKQRIGLRWNGDDHSLGYPHSRGKATWFVIPKEIALAFAENIGDIRMKKIIELSDDSIFV